MVGAREKSVSPELIYVAARRFEFESEPPGDRHRGEQCVVR